MTKIDFRHEEDLRLAHLYFNGDKTAGEVLYFNIFSSVKKYIDSSKLSKTLSPVDKEDVLSDTLKCSIENINYYNGECTFCTYVCGIAKKKILNKCREVSKLSQIEELSENIPLFADPLYILIEKEKYNEISNAFKKLPQRHNTILNCKLSGVSAKDTSGKLNCSLNSYYVMYHRAVKSLKKHLNSGGMLDYV